METGHTDPPWASDVAGANDCVDWSAPVVHRAMLVDIASRRITDPASHRANVHSFCRNTRSGASDRGTTMLWTIIVILAIVWLIATVLKFTLGGLIHVLLLIAVGLMIWNLIKGAT